MVALVTMNELDANHGTLEFGGDDDEYYLY